MMNNTTPVKPPTPAPTAVTPTTTTAGYPHTPQQMTAASVTNPALLQQQKLAQAQNLTKTQLGMQQLQYQQLQQLQQQQQQQQHQQQQQAQQAAQPQQTQPITATHVAHPTTAATVTAAHPSAVNVNAATAAASAAAMAQAMQQPEETEIISRKKLQDLVAQISTGEVLDPDVEEVMLEVVDDFIDSVMTFACQLAKHRNSTTLEVKDIQCHLERNWNIRIPGYSNTDNVRPFKRPQPSDAHKTRLALVRKSLAPPAKQQKLQ